MDLRKVIRIGTIIASVLAIGITAAISFGSSYTEYREQYDAVMDEKERSKYETIEGVTVKNVSLENVDNKPSYVISGEYDETVDPETLSFKLNTYADRANFAEIVNKEYDVEKRTFKMSTDITYTSADGDGNTNYNLETGSISISV